MRFLVSLASQTCRGIPCIFGSLTSSPTIILSITGQLSPNNCDFPLNITGARPHMSLSHVTVGRLREAWNYNCTGDRLIPLSQLYITLDKSICQINVFDIAWIWYLHVEMFMYFQKLLKEQDPWRTVFIQRAYNLKWDFMPLLRCPGVHLHVHIECRWAWRLNSRFWMLVLDELVFLLKKLVNKVKNKMEPRSSVK